MKKVINFLSNNLLFILCLFLLAFIPLYPKIPILKVSHTWVYVRAEDLIVAGVFTLWLFLVLFRKVKLKTPITLPILIFWILGAISTFHGVLIIFPTLANVFPNVAFLSFIRRIEYITLFFIAFSSVRDKKYINYVIATLAITLFLVTLYGFGQRYLGFPAYLTGNEEFAKGLPLKLSSLSRIPSTFGGNYDLAAYLVLIIPILVSLVIGGRNLLVRVSFSVISFLGLLLLFLTVSRISFFALLVSLFLLLVLHKKKIFLILLFAGILAALVLSPRLIQRFGNTVSEVNVLVDANTGEALGQVAKVPKDHFKDKVVLRENASLKEKGGNSQIIVPYSALPETIDLLLQPNVPTGEILPQGTGYINLPLSPIVNRVGEYYVEDRNNKTATAKVARIFEGNYLIKRAKAYDLSSTTRFQGEWPRTIDAFKRNIFIGSGYGSVSLAVDNNYLRILGESGILGFLSFFLIFLTAGIYIKKALPRVDSPVVRSFIFGFIAGALGLCVNAILIDVFEASKIAFLFWGLMGLTLGVLHLYYKEDLNSLRELKKVLISPYAIVVYIFIGVIALYSPLISNYFAGDDFTWLRWGAMPQNLSNIFTNSDGFFYRPGEKLYFLVMYKLFWLNQTPYHIVSVFLHFGAVVLSFMVFRKIFKNYSLAVLASFLFLFSTGYQETIFWIASSGHLFNGLFALFSLLTFIYWKERRSNFLLILTVVFIFMGMLFQELGVVTPLILIFYDLIFAEKVLFKKVHLLLLFPILPYSIFRFTSNSQWFSGDYSYNILKLPFNIVGNLIGYLLLDSVGSQVLSPYESIRNFLRLHIPIAIIILLVSLGIFYVLYKFILKRIVGYERKLIIFGLVFSVVSLLPFIGLGNMTSRYGYLSSIGYVIILTLFIRRAFIYLFTLGDKYSSVLILSLISVLFLSVQLFQLQKVHSDWAESGKIVEKTLVSFEGAYKGYWIGKPVHFYFVDVPIKNGEAWIFPVGLKDAIWFSLRNDEMTVDQVSSVEEAFSFVKDPRNSNVFKIGNDGQVQEYERSTDGRITPVAR